MFASIPDLLRFVAVPVFAWAAYRDVRTRRVPNWVWLPLGVVGVFALILDGRSVLAVSVSISDVQSLFFLRVAVSLGVVAPLGYAFWRLGGFGGADAKAIMTLALLFPTYPAVYFSWAVFPLEPSTLGVFSLTILTNTVLIALIVPFVLAGRNARHGRLTPAMFVGRPIPVEDVTSVYGRILETDGKTICTTGLDIDALRMYLRWRGTTLDSIRSAPTAHRDPESIPVTPNDPGDGSLAECEELLTEQNDTEKVDSPRIEKRGRQTTTDSSTVGEYDAWGAAAFLSAVDGDAYGTTPQQLRSGLELLSSSGTESVWITPGLPFLVVVFFGLLSALTYGDLLVTMLPLGL